MKSEVLKQIKILKEGLVDLISEEELAKKIEISLNTKRPLRVKYGADPSAPDLHLGHTVPLRKLQQFQQLGHAIVFIIGDFTARVGDPTQRSETRKMLTREEVNRNAISYQHQVFKILDSQKTETRYNSEWLGKMTPENFLLLTSKYTVAQLLERDDFQNRFRLGRPIALIEFLYPLLQGYDSVIVRSDIEIGGTDQKFNLLVGRDLMREAGMEPQVVMTLPIIEGTDGVQKMSKSLGNAVALQDAPQEMYGKVMSIPDALMENYYRYVSGLPSHEVNEILQALKDGSLHPRDAKARLAERIVGLYHDSQAAREAGRQFDEIFQKKGLPDEIEALDYGRPSCDLVTLLKETRLVSSKGEGRRLIQQGGVKVDREKVTDVNAVIDLSRPVLVQCGKRKFAKISFRSQPRR